VNSLLDQAAGLGLGLYARLLGATVRVRTAGEQHLQQALGSGRPVIFAGWHGQTHLLYPLMHGRLDFSRMVMMVVGDERVDVLSRFARTIGVEPFPVAREDESMSGARNFLRLVQLLRDGRYSYMTPDGPDGPPRVAKPGVAFLAERAGALLVALGAFTRTCYRLRRWDRYALPLPFSRVYASIRPPLSARRGDDHQRLLAALAVELDASIEEARRLGGG